MAGVVGQRRNRIAAAAKKAEAEATGLSLRAIQKKHKAKAIDSPALDIPAPTPSRPLLNEEDYLALPEPERQMRLAWEIWDYIRTVWEALKKPDKDGKQPDALYMSELGLSVSKLRLDYIKARGDYEDYLRGQRLTVSNTEIDQVQADFWTPFIRLLQNMPMEIASMCPHEIRDTVANVVNDYLCSRVQPQADRLIDGLEALTRTP